MQIQTLAAQLSEVSVKRSEVEAKMDAEHKETKATLNQQLIFTAQQDDQIKTLVAQLSEASLLKERGEEMEIKAKFAAEMEEVCVLLFWKNGKIPVF
jgi:hypothetical protein